MKGGEIAMNGRKNAMSCGCSMAHSFARVLGGPGGVGGVGGVRDLGVLIFVLLFVCICRFGGAASAEATSFDIGENLEARQLHDAIWVVTSLRPWRANSLVVRLEDGTVVLADTPPTTAYTEALLDWVERELEPSSVVAINGHYHVDAAGGNALLLERDITVWASQHTGTLLAEKGAGVLAELRRMAEGTEDEGLWDDAVIAAPTDSFDPRETKVLRFGNQEVHLIFPGASHTPDLIVTYFPDLELLFGGCMVKAGKTMGYLGDADLETWPAAISRLQELPARWVIPGHGSRVDPGLLRYTLDLLAAHDSPD